MVYETSYESGRKPYHSDITRGKWTAPSDFVYACMGLAFKLDTFTVSTWFFYKMGGMSAMVPNILCLGLYLVPLIVIQSFMGQFSSSGFMSAFRLTPFFKGIGYVSLGLNIAMLLYYNIFAAVPFLFLFNSFRPTLPWSCEGISEWSQELSKSERSHLCNITANYDNFDDDNGTFFYMMRGHHIPSVLYFRHHFEEINFYHYDKHNFEISWAILGCTFLLWAIIVCIFYKFSETSKFGTMLKYLIWSTVALLLVCLLRFIFLPGAFTGVQKYFKPSIPDFFSGLVTIPIFALQSFGGGWGTIIALSSFNNFKTDIMKHSWIICLGQMFIYCVYGLVSFILEAHFNSISENNYNDYVEYHWTIYVSTASALANIKWANLWTIIFYTMVIMSTITVMCTQIFAILKSLFDEFEVLRSYKREATLGFIGFLALFSIYFCSNHGILYFSAISMDSLFVQTVLHLLLILVVLWIYGRDRFQRDLEFMLNRPFATWKVNVLRFVAPVFLIINLFATLFIAVHEHFISSIGVLIIAVLVVVLPLLSIPGYGIFIMLQNTGTFCERFKRACRPTDWYPFDADDRQRYEESMGNLDITHQLREVTEENL